jgi:hypothetical protein
LGKYYKQQRKQASWRETKQILNGYHMTRWRCKLKREILPTWHGSKA